MSRWPLVKRIAFRFFTVYFSLYVLTTQMLTSLIIVPGVEVPEFSETGPIRWLVEWTAHNIFGVTGPLAMATGSGDKIFDWIYAGWLLVVTTAATVVWSIAARGQLSYAVMHSYYRLFVRFALGATLVSYGAIKAIPLQMSYPRLERLVEPYGHFSPMGVLWASIGAARPYQIFTGCMELTAGILLFIPQTAALGALLSFACSILIFTLNMTYDVPVKLFALHLVVLSVFLLAPDARRVVNLVVLDRPASRSSVPPLGSTSRRMRTFAMAQIVLGLYLVAMNMHQAVEDWRTRGGGAPKSPLYGIWNVAYMSMDGVERAPLVTDYERWRRVIFNMPPQMSFQRMDDTFVSFGVKIDTAARSIALTKATDPKWTASLVFERPAPDRMTLDGEMDGRKIVMRLELYPREKFLLVSRGFNWIQERPFNR